MFFGTDNIMHTILQLNINMGIFHIILLVPQNTSMDLNNVMVKFNAIFLVF